MEGACGLFLFKNYFLFCFLALLGAWLHTGCLSSYGERACSSLGCVLITEHKPQGVQAHSCGAGAQLLCGCREFSQTRIEPMSLRCRRILNNHCTTRAALGYIFFAFP